LNSKTRLLSFIWPKIQPGLIAHCWILILPDLNQPRLESRPQSSRDWSTRGVVKSPTAFLNHEKTTLYLYTKPNPDPKSVDY